MTIKIWQRYKRKAQEGPPHKYCVIDIEARKYDRICCLDINLFPKWIEGELYKGPTYRVSIYLELNWRRGLDYFKTILIR